MMDFLPSFLRAPTLDVTTRITKLATLGKPQEDFIYTAITDWSNDPNKEIMLTAQKYFINQSDISQRKRYYLDRKGVKKEITLLSNSKLSHPFLRKLVNQKIRYLLSKEPSFQTDNDAFSELLTMHLDKHFLRMLKNVGRHVILNGVSWVQAYYNEQGILKFKRIPSEEVIPFWSDAEHTEVAAIVRVYSILQYLERGEKKEIRKVEYHTKEGVWYFVMGDKGLIEDPDHPEMFRGHFRLQQTTVDEEGNPVMTEQEIAWEKVPFIPFKYNADELSLLQLIKPLIDDYDVNASDTSNNIQDIPNNIKMIRNYDGTNKEEFAENLSIFRMAFVGEDGDIKTVETPLDISTVDSHLNRLRKDIYEAGSGVDTQELSLGNVSGVALRFRYADLDGDCDDFANEITASLEELLWFIKVDLLNSGKGDFMNEDVEIVFNTDNILVESEVIEDAKNSAGLISEETILTNHPWVTDVQQEQERLQKERQAALAEMQAAMGEESNFGNEEPNDEPEGSE